MDADSPLKTAIEQGDAPRISLLLAEDPGLIDRGFYWSDRQGRRRLITPIRYANACDRQESIDALVAAGANLGFLCQALDHSVGSRNRAEFKRLLARGVRPPPGHLPGLDSVGPERCEFINALIAAGVAYEDGSYMDIHRGDLATLAQRLQEDSALVHRTFADTSHAIPTSGTLLHIAAAHNDADFVDLLIGNGADIDAIGPIHGPHYGRGFQVIFDGTGGQTPIYYAIGRAYGCCYEAFDRLLQHGPDLAVRAQCHVDGTIAEVTPLGYALARQRWLSEPDGALNREQREVQREIDRLRALGAPE